MAKAGRTRAEYIGERFGRLLVTGNAPDELVGKFAKRFVHTKCDCGVESIKPLYCLTRGVTTSCGCYASETSSKGMKQRRANLSTDNTAHGHARKSTRSRTYITWISMRRRCESEKATQYRYYGARGIKVCERWGDFANFISDMGERPEGKTLDRIDPDGDYTPTNCRWATAEEQRANRRDSKQKQP